VWNAFHKATRCPVAPEFAIALLVLRLVAAGIFVAQGSRKLFAPAEAPHGRANLERLIAQRDLPRPDRLAWLVAVTELLGGFALVLGILTRLATVPLAVVLVVAIFGYKWRAGFIGGWDWPLSVLAIVVAIGLAGAGPISLDALLRIP
jgi:putative oxidoreductase